MSEHPYINRGNPIMLVSLLIALILMMPFAFTIYSAFSNGSQSRDLGATRAENLDQAVDLIERQFAIDQSWSGGRETSHTVHRQQHGQTWATYLSFSGATNSGPCWVVTSEKPTLSPDRQSVSEPGGTLFSDNATCPETAPASAMLAIPDIAQALSAEADTLRTHDPTTVGPLLTTLNATSTVATYTVINDIELPGFGRQIMVRQQATEPVALFSDERPSVEITIGPHPAR